MTQPFDHQLQCIEAFKNHFRFGNFSDMGTGKTLVSLYTYAYLHSKNPSLKLVVICPKSLKREWVNEIKKHLGVEFSSSYQVITTGNSTVDPKKHIYIINYDILKPKKLKGKKRLSRWTKALSVIYPYLKNAMMVVDECFPYDTTVSTDKGKLAIGDIVENKLNVSVLSCNLQTGVLEYKKVVNWFANPIPNRTVIIQHSNGCLTCSATHKIYTERGYVYAEKIQCGERMFLLQEQIPNTNKRKSYGKVLQQSLLRESKVGKFGIQEQLDEYTQRKEKIHYIKVPILWGRASNTFSRHKSRHQKKVLYKKLCYQAPTKDYKLKGKSKCRYSFSCKAREDRKTCKCRLFKYIQKESPFYRIRLRYKGWKRKGTYCSAVKVNCSVRGRLVSRISCSNKNYKKNYTKYSQLLQNRCSQCSKKDSCRSRRKHSLWQKSAVVRSEKGSSIISVRVESIKILEHGSAGEAGGSNSKDRYFYDIEVADNHNYFADGILVSNCQKCGHYTSQRTKVVMDVCNEAKYFYAMTGTPMLNKPETLFPIMWMLGDPDLRCWTQYMAQVKFIEEFCEKDFFGKIVGYKNLDKLRNRLANLSIRFSKDVLNLPEVIHNTYYTELEGEQLHLYTSMRDELVAYINTLTQKQIAKEAANILVQMLRLLQICSMPQLLGHHTGQVPAKIHVLDELIAEHIQDKKIIISTVFRGMNDYIMIRYQEHKPVSLMGGMFESQIEAVKKKFTEGDSRIMVMHPAVGGIGLNLTSSNMIIFYDRNFSFTEWLQTQARIHRIGQINKCYIAKIVAENTIDEKVDEAIRLKEVLANKVLTSSEVVSFKSKVLHLLSERTDDTMPKFDFGLTAPQQAAPAALQAPTQAQPAAGLFQAQPSFPVFAAPSAPAVDNRMNQLNQQLQQQANAAMQNLATAKALPTIDDPDAALLKGLFNKTPAQQSLPINTVPVPTPDIQVSSGNDQRLIEMRFNQLECNLGNVIREESTVIREYMVKNMMPGLTKMAEKILELEAKINQLSQGDIRTGAEVAAPKKTRTKSRPREYSVQVDTTPPPAQETETPAVTVNNAQLYNAAAYVDDILKKNGLNPPWDVSSEQQYGWIKTILNNNGVVDESIIQQIATVLHTHFK